ncbi:uncharacterized protein LOC143854586 [Tasmannia lanceolata]|uniref:uncharacterized protein LOC143854586 n=1 Tax=Tasmannia lanceolata TaxID=3420 RepID=UPI004062EC09
MIDAKFNEYVLANTATIIPTCDKQQPVSGKKKALRDLQNEPRNIVTQLLGNSPLSKDGRPIVDASKVTGNKRPKLDCPTSPTNGTNEHLVYVRRKAELESGKLNACDIENAYPPQSRKSGYRKQEPLKQDNQMEEPNNSCFLTLAPMPVLKPAYGLTVAEQNNPLFSTGTSTLVNPQKTCGQYWEERLLRLKMFLKNCEQSNHEEYIQSLRSLSAAERSRHAVDLERRSIRLSLEEVKEMHRMQVLNVLGKSGLKCTVSPSTQAHFQLLASLKQEEQMHCL